MTAPNSINISFSWTGPTRYGARDEVIIGSVELKYGDNAKEVFVCPEDSNKFTVRQITGMPCSGISSQSTPSVTNLSQELDRLRLTAMQMQNLVLVARYFEQSSNASYTGYRNGTIYARFSPNVYLRDIKLSIPQNLIPGRHYTLQVSASDTLQLSAQLV